MTHCVTTGRLRVSGLGAALSAGVILAGCASTPASSPSPPDRAERETRGAAPEPLEPPAPPPSLPAVAGKRLQALSLAEVLSSIEATHPALEAIRRDVDAAYAELLAAEGGFDPLLRGRASALLEGHYESRRVDVSLEQPTPLWGASLFGGYRLGEGDFAVYDGKLETENGGEVRAGLKVPLLRDGPIDRRRASIRRAELLAPLASLSHEEQRLVLARIGASRYWDWAAAGLRLGLARALLAVAVERDALVRVRVEAGDLPEMERVENARAILQRQGQVVSAERALEQGAIDLSLFYRASDGTPIEPPPERLPAALPDPPPLGAESLGAALERALSTRPELRRLDALREQQLIERRLARNQVLPSVDISLVASKDMGSGRKDLDRAEVEASLMVEVPLFQRTARGRLDAAGAALAKLEAQARGQRDRIVAEVRDARSAMDAARRRLDAARRELAVARDLERIERERFDAGEGTLLLVNLREQAAIEAAFREVDALADAWRARAAFAAAVGEVEM